MGKSRLADAFGKACPMINFVLREEEDLGYPPADTEVLSFMRERLSKDDQEKIMVTPRRCKLSSGRISEEDKKKIKNPEREDEAFRESVVTTVRNHSIAVGLLQASFEICKLRPLFITTKAQVLIQNSQCVGQRTKT